MRFRATNLTAFAAPFVLIGALTFVGCGDDDDNGNGEGEGSFCENACAAIVAAECTNGPPSFAECVDGCGSVENACPTEFAALRQCAGLNAAYTCDAYGAPAPSNCESEHGALQACLTGTDPYCYAACPAVVAAGCSNGPPDLSECLGGCTDVATACSAEFATLKQCTGQDPTFTCDADDSPAPDGCTTENDALNACAEMQ